MKDPDDILRETLEVMPEVIKLVRDLLAAGRTPEEVIEHIQALGPAARLDVDAVALDEARKIREGR